MPLPVAVAVAAAAVPAERIAPIIPRHLETELTRPLQPRTRRAPMIGAVAAIAAIAIAGVVAIASRGDKPAAVTVADPPTPSSVEPVAPTVEAPPPVVALTAKTETPTPTPTPAKTETPTPTPTLTPTPAKTQTQKHVDLTPPTPKHVDPPAPKAVTDGEIRKLYYAVGDEAIKLRVATHNDPAAAALVVEWQRLRVDDTNGAPPEFRASFVSDLVHIRGRVAALAKQK